MSNDITPYVERGFTEEEASILKKWIDKGKPGLSKHKADHFAEVYVLGYSCQDLNKWFPEYPLEIILWARYFHNWDELREQYKKVRTQTVLETAVGAQADGLRFLTEVLHATHYRWRKELIEYLANPEGKKPPDCLPNSLGQYANLTGLMREIMGINPSKDGKKAGETSSSPLISININDDKKPAISVAGADDIKEALIKDVQNAERIQRN